MMTQAEFQSKWQNLESLLYGFAMKLTGNREDANDLMQETVFKAYRNRGKYQLNTNFKAWTTTIMRNTFINAYRKKRRRNKVEAPVEDLLYTLSNKASADLADASVKAKDLYATLDTLSETYRVPFLMFFRGYEYKEIAEHLDIPIGTVKSRIFCARRNLRGRHQGALRQ